MSESAIKTLKEAKEITGGGITKGNTKMPFWSYGISAWDCKVGSKLAKVKGSVCSNCYARKHRYKFKNLMAAFKKRSNSITSSKWIQAMVFQIKHYCKDNQNYFRFHDTGDVQSLQHFKDIMEIARQTPDVHYWLPTREVEIIKKADKEGLVPPSNLMVRVSSHMVGQKPFSNLPKWCTTSTVDWEKATDNCPAYKQGGQCGDCRNCWDKNVQNVNYPEH
jgi:hypothetical protein